LKSKPEPLPGKYIYGMDPASKADFFGIVIHKIPLKEKGQPLMAQLVRLEAITHTSYLHIFEMLQRDLFEQYPPFYICLDYNTEKTISEILVRDYGKDHVEPMNFSNDTKNRLKDDGLAILKQGYKFPNPTVQQDQRQRKLLDDLIKQLHQEQMLQTPGGKITFDHPVGEHNDLAVAWELSVHGCLKFMINSTDGPAVAATKRPAPKGWGIPDDADPISELHGNPHIRINNTWVNNPV